MRFSFTLTQQQCDEINQSRSAFYCFEYMHVIKSILCRNDLCLIMGVGNGFSFLGCEKNLSFGLFCKTCVPVSFREGLLVLSCAV